MSVPARTGRPDPSPVAPNAARIRHKPSMTVLMSTPKPLGWRPPTMPQAPPYKYYLRHGRVVDPYFLVVDSALQPDNARLAIV